MKDEEITDGMRVDWRKSSFSGPYSDNCVEVARIFRKSSRSQLGQDCVEVAEVSDGTEVVGVLVRDSKDPHGPVLEFDQTVWAAFIAGAKANEFDL